MPRRALASRFTLFWSSSKVVRLPSNTIAALSGVMAFEIARNSDVFMLDPIPLSRPDSRRQPPGALNVSRTLLNAVQVSIIG